MPSLFKYREKGNSVRELARICMDFMDKNLPEYDIRKKLFEISLSQNPYRTDVTSKRMVNSAIKFAKQGMKLEPDPISFSYEELDFIESICDDAIEKQLFILFCLYKTRGDSFDFEQSKFISDCKIKKSEFDLSGLVTCDENDNLFYVKMCKNNTGKKTVSSYIKSLYNEENIAFTINNYDNIIYYYEKYKNPEKYIYCKNCGKIIKKIKNNQRYCRECAKDVNLRKTSDSLRVCDNTKEIKCSKCGRYFFINSKSKKTLCDKCYKEKRRIDVSNNKRRMKEGNQESFDSKSLSNTNDLKQN